MDIIPVHDIKRSIPVKIINGNIPESSPIPCITFSWPFVKNNLDIFVRCSINHVAALIKLELRGKTDLAIVL